MSDSFKIQQFLGTPKDNARDRQNKGRFTPPRFDRDEHPRTKITTDLAQEIRSKVVRGRGGNARRLAKEYSVSLTTIYNVIQ